MMFDVTLGHVLAASSYHLLNKRLMSVLQHAKQCAHACGDVRRYVPYGLPNDEADTADSVQIKCQLMGTPVDTADTSDSPILSALREAVAVLDSVEREQEAYLTEFADSYRARGEWAQNTVSQTEVSWFDVLEPPSL